MNGFERAIAMTALVAGFGGSSRALAQVDVAWTASYDGPGSAPDGARDLVVDAGGCVYVTGFSSSSSSSGDFATLKYDSSGALSWVAIYDAAGNGDYAEALAVDGAGNVYVTGESTGPGGTYFDLDYATVKYDPNGNEIWVRRYDGPAGSRDEVTAIAVDGAGNCYVTGGSDGSGSGAYTFDIATVKYDPDGNELWIARWDGPGLGQQSWDIARDLVVDDAGNVYVTGWTDTPGGWYDAVTIKYAADGTELWAKRYDAANRADGGNALALDASGNVYVAAVSAVSQTSHYDYSTLKYSPNGALLWARTYGGVGDADDITVDLAVDEASNVFVTGRTNPTAVNNQTRWSCTTIKYDAVGTEAWVRSVQSTRGCEGRAIEMGASGAVYVAAREGWPDERYLTIKYDSLGNEAWALLTDTPGSDESPTALAVGPGENVYVTGGHATGSTTVDEADYLTICLVQEVGHVFCSGDGSASPCPCGNPGDSGEGCAHSLGMGGGLTATGSDSAAADDLAFHGTSLVPWKPALLFVGEDAINGGAGVPFGDGLRCAGTSVVRLGVETPGATGATSWSSGLGVLGGWSVGDTRYFQAWYRDPNGPCGSGFNLTNGVEVTFRP